MVFCSANLWNRLTYEAETFSFSLISKLEAGKESRIYWRSTARENMKNYFWYFAGAQTIEVFDVFCLSGFYSMYNVNNSKFNAQEIDFCGFSSSFFVDINIESSIIINSTLRSFTSESLICDWNFKCWSKKLLSNENRWCFSSLAARNEHAKLRQQPHEVIGKQARTSWENYKKRKTAKWVMFPFLLSLLFFLSHSQSSSISKFYLDLNIFGDVITLIIMKRSLIKLVPFPK